MAVAGVDTRLSSHQFKGRSGARVGWVVIVAILLAGVVGLITIGPVRVLPQTGENPRAAAAASAKSFLADYGSPDGRIIRWDQGGDTVSEGQAYGMLVAVALGDRGAFDSIWSWTKSRLLLTDGLLAWHWQSGAVVDHMAASDADVDAAFALALAGNRFGVAAWSSMARHMAASVLANETVVTPLGLLLVAGPWARSQSIAEPGYFSPEAFQTLGRVTRDPRWQQVDATSQQVLTRFTSTGQLAPDWVSVSPTGVVAAISAPNATAAGPSFGPDAARVAPWWSASCVAADRRIAAEEWPQMRTTAAARDFALVLGLDGRPQGSYMNPVMAVSDAAAASAVGEHDTATSLLGSARHLNRQHSTYYGSAWLALGQLLLTGGTLGSCQVL